MNENTLQNRKSKRAPAVVVGVDGSAGAKAALRWALGEARLRNSPVRAVHAWTFGYIGGSVKGYPYWGGSIGSYASLGVDLNDLQQAAKDLLDGQSPTSKTKPKASKSNARSSRGLPPKSSSKLLPLMISSSSDLADTAGSPASCSALSASNACITPSARSSSSTPPSQPPQAASPQPPHKRKAPPWQ